MRELSGLLSISVVTIFKMTVSGRLPIFPCRQSASGSVRRRLLVGCENVVASEILLALGQLQRNRTLISSAFRPSF